MDGGTNENSAVTVTGVAVGNHNVTFSAIPGWITPGNQTISVSANSLATAAGAYVEQTQYSSAPYNYTTNARNTVTITGYTGPPWAVTIPATINGMAGRQHRIRCVRREPEPDQRCNSLRCEQEASSRMRSKAAEI